MSPTSEASETNVLNGLTMRYATHVAALSFEDMPEAVVEKAKLILRDGVGNEIAASAISEPANRMVSLVEEWGGASQSTIIGHGSRVPAPHAALVNAMSASRTIVGMAAAMVESTALPNGS